MDYHYMAWKQDGYWAGQKLLSLPQIATVLHHLDWKHEVFQTIQTYDEQEQILSCPIYADFDHKDKNLASVQADVQAFVFRIMGELNVIPEIYFSGNKGFHVILPYPVVSPHCHYLVRHVVNHFGQDLGSLDKNVYRPRSMFRLPGSPASIPGRYKTQITNDELFGATVDEIIALSRQRIFRRIPSPDIEKLPEEVINELLREGEALLPRYDNEHKGQRSQAPMTPCVRHFLNKGVAPGQRNKAIFILAKHLKNSELSLGEAEAVLLAQPHIKDWQDSGAVKVLSVLRSVYRSSQPTRIGCRKGADSELMQTYCNSLCPFSPEFPELHFGKVRA